MAERKTKATKRKAAPKEPKAKKISENPGASLNLLRRARSGRR
jgi:hypothetical protein